MASVAVIGAGLIGRAWAIVFARGGYEVRLYDTEPGAVQQARRPIAEATADLERAGLLDDPEGTVARISTSADLDVALDGATYVQECAPERREAKWEIFVRLDRFAPPEAILASSSSGIVPNAFIDNPCRPERCLVAHPVNPSYLIPLVKLCPSPRTTAEAVKRARSLLEDVGQVPILVRREVQGFILNRLQGAVLNEALRLFEDGCVSAEDIDRTVRDGLGLRWSFMGPLETIDLNALGGLRDYAARYGALYEALGQEQADPRPWWREETVERLHEGRREKPPTDDLPGRQSWRDRRLMALVAHKRSAACEFGG